MDAEKLAMEGGLTSGVVAAIVTHRRPMELRRLLGSLELSEVPLRGCVISDHAPGGKTREIAARMNFETVILEEPENPGPGAGWAHAAKKAAAHFGEELDAVWYLDDDVVLQPDTLKFLLQEMRDSNAVAIAPLLEDEAGRLWAFPEPEPSSLRKLMRSAKTPADALRLLGDKPIPFCWCTGACFLVRRQEIERVGWHRSDFWLLGEDLEYSMRIAAGSRAVFSCKVSVAHLPPAATDAGSAQLADYRKFCSLLQNLSYLSFHTPHSRHMMRYLPGNFRRLFRTHGFRARTLRDATACFWNGAILASPSGTALGEDLRTRINHYDWQN